MARVEATFRTAGTRNLLAGSASTDVQLLGGGGGGGNGGALARGGGGGGGAYAGTPGLATVPGATYALVVGDGGNAATAGTPSTFSSVTASNQRTAPAQSFSANNAIDQAAVGALVLTPASGTTPPSLFASAGGVGESVAALPIPSGVQPGDIIIVAAYTTNQSVSGIPTGWTIHRNLLDSYFVASRVVQSADEAGTNPWSARTYRGFSYSVWRGAGSLTADYVGNVGSASDANAAAVSVPASGAYNQGSIRVHVFPSRAGGSGISSLIYNIPSGVTAIYNEDSQSTGLSVGRSAFQAYEPLTVALATGATLVRAAAGSPGANQSGLGAGAGGAGGTVANSIGTTRTAGGTGTNGGAGGQGAAPLGGAGNAFGDGGEGGQILGGAGGLGEDGLAVIAFDTGTPGITHEVYASRLATLSRNSAAAIAHSAAFQRLATLLRTASATTAHVSVRYGLLIILLPRTATTAHAAAITRKLVRLARSSSVAHTATTARQTIFERLATVSHGAFFARAVTVRRAFLATITHKRRTLVTLDAERVPGSGGVVTQVFRSLFVFDD